MANIAIAKMAKSILFDKQKWSPIGGDNEAPLLVYALAKTYPQHDFWIIGKSDYSKIFGDKDLLPNIHDIWNKKYWIDGNPMNYIKNDYYEDPDTFEKFYSYVTNVFKKQGVTIDFCFMLWGMFFSNSHFNVIPLQNGEGYAKTLEVATKYGSFLINWLNKTKPEYASITTDPRQYRVYPRDLIHWPKVCLSQIDKTIKFVSKTTVFWPKDNQIKDPLLTQDNVYSGVETINLLSREPITSFENKTEFNMILNQGNPGDPPPRYLELKKWILDDKDFTCNIYGKWNDDIIKSDNRFKGIIHPNSLGNVLKNTKYTLCIPISSGWITSKFVEMLHYGVIPFVTADYASCVKNHYIPESLIVKSRNELKEKIKLIEEHNLGDSIINALRNDILFKSNKYNGEYLFNTISSVMKEHNTQFTLENPSFIGIPISVAYSNDFDKLLNQGNSLVDVDELF